VGKMVSKKHAGLKKVQEALKESEAKYHTITELSPVGIFHTDAKGNCTYVNKKWCKIAGLTPKQAQGEGWTKGLHPEDRKHIFKEWYKAAKKKTPFRLEYRFKRPDGTVTWVYGQAAAKKSDSGKVVGYVGTITDITLLKNAEEKLKESEEKYKSLVEGIKKEYFFYSHDTKGIFRFISSSVTDMLGYKPREFLKSYTTYLTDNPINKGVIEHTKKSMKGIKQPPYLVEIYHKNGSIKTLEVTETPVFDENGKVTAVEGIAQDITEKEKAEERLREYSAKLDENNIKLKEANKLTSRFASIAAHELKVPSNIIINDAEFIFENYLEEMKPEVKKKVDLILKNAKRLRTTIQQVLAMTWAEVKGGLLFERFELNKLIGEIVKFGMIPLAKKKNIDIHLHLQGIPHVNADRNKITEVISNLIDNAIKYTKEGGLIDVKSNVKGTGVIVEVHDTGIGIAEKHIPKLFTRFYTIGRKGESSMGLGLTTCKEIIGQHKGRIGVKSQLGKGSVFWFTLPVGKKEFRFSKSLNKK